MNLRLTIIIAMLFITSCSSDYEQGIKNYKADKYVEALEHLRKVKVTDDKYDSAQIKISEIEKILADTQIEKERRDSIAYVEQQKKELEDFKNQLKREIEVFKTFDGNKYRGDVSAIQTELVIFAAWAGEIRRAEYSSDIEVRRLGKTLKAKVINLQKSEFPKLRKAYGAILKEKLWVENINVKTIGTGYTILEFEGGVFASNKNIQDTQETFRDMLNQLRFKRTNYKWYEYDDEYTYYSMKTGKDSDLVSL